MCRTDPGPRCSKCATDKRNSAQKSLSNKTTELSEYEEKWANSLTTPDDQKTKQDVVRANKHKRLISEKEDLEEQASQAEFVYNSTQVGQDELKKQIEEAKAAGDDTKVAELEAKLAKGKEHHEWQLKTARKLKKTVNTEGPDVAAEQAEEIFVEAKKEEETVTEKLEDLHEELGDLQEEEEVYEQQIEDHESGKKVLTPAELRLARAKHRRRVALIVSIVAAIAIYGLIKEASTGRQSQMFGFLKGMAHKHGHGKAQSIFSDMFAGNASFVNERRSAKQQAKLDKQDVKYAEKQEKKANRVQEKAENKANPPEKKTKATKPKRTPKEKKITLDKAKETVEKSKHDPLEWDSWMNADDKEESSTSNTDRPVMDAPTAPTREPSDDRETQTS